MSSHAEAPPTSSSKLKPKLSRKSLPYIVAVFAAGMVAAAMIVRAGGSRPTTSVGSYESTARVEIRDLVETETYEGTLGYADSRSLLATAQGTLTDSAREGSTVKRGETLYAMDEIEVVLLYGSTPMYRDLTDGVSDGNDVRQLEANLVAMGYDPDGEIDVDGEWDDATTAAVERWEEDRGIIEDGSVTRAEAIFLPGPRVIGEHSLETGAPVNPGSGIMTTSSRQRIVSLDVEVENANRFSRGQGVSIELPNNEEVRGVVSSVGRVATVDETDEGADPTVEVTITLRRTASTGRFVQAAVDVIAETSRVKDAISVPVNALLTTTHGLAVEVIENGRIRVVDVEVGAYADGWVEVSGKGLNEGTEVVTAS